MTLSNFYHEGERAVQERAGECDAALRNERIVAREIPGRALDFPAQQYSVVLATVDAAGDVWASLGAGEPGFVRATGPTRVELDAGSGAVAPRDPFWAGVYPGATVGMLFLEPETRRRLRVNGRIARGRPRVVIEVNEAYPNCRKYVHRRARSRNDANTHTSLFAEEGLPRRGATLALAHRQWIGEADTMFVASHHPDRGADASHRGGPSGFLSFVDDQTILVPDYPGNSLFNTLGNLLTRPSAGLLFTDLEAGRMLQLTGEARVLWDVDRPPEETVGTHRYWTFTVTAWVESAIPGCHRWTLTEHSPFIPSK